MPLTPISSASKRTAHDTCPGGGMVDALASGASTRKGVEVRVLSWAPKNSKTHNVSKWPLGRFELQSTLGCFECLAVAPTPELLVQLQFCQCCIGRFFVLTD